jgi:DNA-binding CsgD family transcriptional regulator
MKADYEAEAGADAGEGGICLASNEAGRFLQDGGASAEELGPGAVATALARMMDLAPAELVLCSPGGAILHANPGARARLDAGEDRGSLREEIRFLCVGLHLQIAEEGGGGTIERVPHAERRVTLDGSDVHLRAVDLGISRQGRSPATLILIDSHDPLSDADLVQAGLTRAEIRIARLVMRGRTNREIALALSVSIHTVRHHVQHIHDKVGVRSRTQLLSTLHKHKDRTAAPGPSAHRSGRG